MSFFDCHSGLFSAARSGAPVRQPEKQEAHLGLGCGAVQQQPPLAGPGEIAQGAADEGEQVRAPAAAQVPSKASGVAGRCFPAAWGSLAGEPEAASSPTDEPEESQAQLAGGATPSAAAEASPEELAQEDSSWGGSWSQRLLEPEPAALHFECSDPEDAAAGRAAKGCCMPRASRRRTKATKAARHEEHEVHATADSAKAEGGPESKQQGAGEGKRGKSRASAGA